MMTRSERRSRSRRLLEQAPFSRTARDTRLASPRKATSRRLKPAARCAISGNTLVGVVAVGVLACAWNPHTEAAGVRSLPPCPIEDLDHCQSRTDPPGGVWAFRIDRSLTEGAGNYARYADDLIPATTGPVTTVCWWPAYIKANAPSGAPDVDCSALVDQPVDQQWQVEFYYGNGGIPGQLLAMVPIDDADIVKVEVPPPWGGWIYSAPIAGPTLNAGQTYWISFSAMGEGNGEDACNVFWYQSAGGNGWAVGDDDGVWDDGDIGRILDAGGADEGLFDLSWCIDLGRDPNLTEYTGTCCHCAGAVCDSNSAYGQCEWIIEGTWFTRSKFCGGVEYGTPCLDDTDCVDNPDGAQCLIAHLCPDEPGSRFACPSAPANDECPGAEVLAHGPSTCGGALGGTLCASDAECVGNSDGAICGPEDIWTFYDNHCATTSSPNYPMANCECAACDPWNPNQSCTVSLTAKDQWYGYTAPCDGTITVDNCEEVDQSDPIIAVYNLNVTTCGGVAGGTVCVDFHDCTWNVGSDLCAANDCCQAGVDEDCPVPQASESVVCSDERCDLVTCGAFGGLVSLAVQVGEHYVIRNANFDDQSRGSGYINLHLDCSALVAPGPPRGADEMAVPGSPTWPPTAPTTCYADTDCRQEASCLPDPSGVFPGTCYVPKNRYVTVASNPANGASTARRVSVQLSQRLCDGVGPACTMDSECGGATCDDLPISCTIGAECNTVASGAVCASTGTCVQVLGWFGPADAKGYARVVAEANRHYTVWKDERFPIDCGVDELCPAGASCDVGVGGSHTCKWDVDGTELLWDFVFLGDCRISPQIRDMRPQNVGGLEENAAERYYVIESILENENITSAWAYSKALVVPTVRVWTDTMGGVAANIAIPPNGIRSFLDVLAQVRGFKGKGQAHVSWYDLEPEVPDHSVGFLDLKQAVSGLKGFPYPYSDPCTCSGLTPCP